MGSGRKNELSRNYFRYRSSLGQNTAPYPISSKCLKNYDLQIKYKLDEQTHQTHRETDKLPWV